MNKSARKISKIPIIRLLVVAPLLVVGLLYFSLPSQALLPQRYIKLSDNRVSATSNYQLEFTISSSQMLGSIRLSFCSNSPLQGDPCVVPSGFNVANATLVSQTGVTGFSISAASTANSLVLTRTPTVYAGGVLTFELSGVVNPSTPSPYFARLETYASGDTTGAMSDFGGLAFDVENPAQVSAAVPPYLLFCSGLTITSYDCDTATGNYVNFGNFSSAKVSAVETQMVTATNAGSGYAIYIYGPTLSSGNNVIAALTNPDVSRPGTNQFGINLRANTDPVVGADPQGPGGGSVVGNYSIANQYTFNTGDTLVSFTGPSDYRKFTVSYIVNIANGQPVGVYVTTLNYLAMANF